MSESRRLFVGGLFNGASETDLKERFKCFGMVSDIDIRHKKDPEGEVVKTFAFINITCDEKSFKKCISVFNKSKWKGTELQLAAAKESFLSKLKKEQAILQTNLNTESTENREKTKKTKRTKDKNELIGTLAPKVTKPDQNTWVRGRAGKLVPVLNIKQPNKKKLLRHDPTKNIKGVKKLDIGSGRNRITSSIRDLTWNIEEETRGYNEEALFNDSSSSEDDTQIGDSIRSVRTNTKSKNLLNSGKSSKTPVIKDQKEHKQLPEVAMGYNKVITNEGKLKSDALDTENKPAKVSGVDELQIISFDSDSEYRAPVKHIANKQTKSYYSSSDSDEDDKQVFKVQTHIRKQKNILKSDPSTSDQVKTRHEDNNIVQDNMHKQSDLEFSSESEVEIDFKKKGKCILDSDSEVDTQNSSKISIEEASDSDYLGSDSESDHKDMSEKQKVRTKHSKVSPDKECVGLNKYIKHEPEKTSLDRNDSDSESDVPDIESWVKKKNCLINKTPEAKNQSASFNSVIEMKANLELPPRKRKYNSDDESSDSDNLVSEKHFKENSKSKEQSVNINVSQNINSNLKSSSEYSARLDTNQTKTYSDSSSEEEDILDTIASSQSSVIKQLPTKIKNGTEKMSKYSFDFDQSKNKQTAYLIETKKSVKTDEIAEVLEDREACFKQYDIQLKHREYNSDEESNSDKNDIFFGIKHIKKELSPHLNLTKSPNKSFIDSRLIMPSDEYTASFHVDEKEPESESSNSDEEDILDSIAAGKWKMIKQLQGKEANSNKIREEFDRSKSNEMLEKKQKKQKNVFDKSLVKTTLLLSDKDSEVVDNVIKMNNKPIKCETDSTEATSNKLKHDASNKQRLQSIREKAKQVQAQKFLLQKALSTVDSQQKNKKIVFNSDSETEEVISTEGVKNSQKQEKPTTLFSSDDSSDEEDITKDDSDRFKIKPQFVGKHGSKLMALQSKYKNDSRFKLDTRFVESEGEIESEEDEADKEASYEKSEKQKNLEVLEKVMGKRAGSFAPKEKKKTFKDINELSYDPTRKDHEQFEIKTTEEEKKSAHKKNTKPDPTVDEKPAPEVSKERFYKVSDSFKEMFQTKTNSDASDVDEEEKAKDLMKTNEPFSLLNMFGSSIAETRDIQKENASAQWQPLIATNPMQSHYNVSDDEQIKNSISKTEDEIQMQTTDMPVMSQETFFITADDPRLQEGIDFFQRKEPMEDIRRLWEKKRPDLIDGYKLKRKRAMRKKKDLQKYLAKFKKSKKFLHK